MIKIQEVKPEKIAKEAIDLDDAIPTRKLIFKLQPYRKMLYYTQSVECEVSGLAKVKLTDNDITITEVRLFEQISSGGHTKLSGAMLAEFLSKVAMEGGKIEDYLCWWHSHYNFGVGFSPTDLATIARLSVDATLISVCINQLGDLVARIDNTGEGEALLPSITSIGDSVLRRKCQKEAVKKVTVEEGVEIELPKTAGHCKYAPPEEAKPDIDWGRLYRKRHGININQDGHKVNHHLR